VLRRLAIGGACLALIGHGGTLPAGAAVDPNDPTVVVRRITVPVAGSFSYRDDFGDPRAGHTHQGNDLMVPKLRPLLAAADATVRRIFVDNGTAARLTSTSIAISIQRMFVTSIASSAVSIARRASPMLTRTTSMIH